MFHILNFIDEEGFLFAIQFVEQFVEKIKVFRLEIKQAFILKIDIVKTFIIAVFF